MLAMNEDERFDSTELLDILVEIVRINVILKFSNRVCFLKISITRGFKEFVTLNY